MTNVLIKGFVDVTVLNEDGTVKTHQYKENTLTHAALASMFCDFLFRGDTHNGGSETNSDTSGQYLAALERNNSTNKVEGSQSSRDRILQGTNGLLPYTPIFSHRQPATYGLYCLSASIQNESLLDAAAGQFKFDQRTQVAPYIKPDGLTLSENVIFYNEGSLETNFYPSEEVDSQRFIRSRTDCSFNLSDISFTLSLRKTIGAGTIHSVVWGATAPTSNAADHFWARMFDVRSRILSHSNFNYAGYSPFYATEQRLVETNGEYIPHTILWQDTVSPDSRTYAEGGADVTATVRNIFGFDLTVPGSNDRTGENGGLGNLGVEKFTVSGYQYMQRYMQGVIIENNAFGLDHDTNTSDAPSLFFTPNGDGNVSVKVYKVADWKSNPVQSNLTITFNTGGSAYTAILDGTAGITKPVLVHNLTTGNLEVFFTPSFNTTSKKFRVGRAVINPVTFAIVGSVTYFESIFCISNYRLSFPGTSTDPGNAAYPRARAVSGFFDYNTQEYYLPYIKYYDTATNAHLTLPGNNTQDPGRFLRLGVQCTFTSTALVPIRLYIQGYACSGRGYPLDGVHGSDSYISRNHQYNNHGTVGVQGPYRYLLWSYAAPDSTSSETPIRPPLQFIPLTGNAVSTGSFSMASPSQVMCGLDLDEPVTKGSNEVLLLSYGWKITQASSESA